MSTPSSPSGSHSKKSKLQIQHQQALISSYIKDGSSQIHQSPPNALLNLLMYPSLKRRMTLTTPWMPRLHCTTWTYCPHRKCVITSAEFRISSLPLDTSKIKCARFRTPGRTAVSGFNTTTLVTCVGVSRARGRLL